MAKGGADALDPVEFLRRALAISPEDAASVREDAARRTAADDRRERAASRPYPVTAKRWDHGWELHIDGVGVTQTHTGYPGTVADVARDYIATVLDVAPDTVKVDITYEGQDGPTASYGTD